MLGSALALEIKVVPRVAFAAAITIPLVGTSAECLEGVATT
jgi:hypothetical protein